MKIMENIPLRTKVLILVSTISLLSIVVIFLFSWRLANKYILEDSFNKLTAIREIKANQIESYYENIHSQVSTFSEDKMVIEAMQAFNAAFEVVANEFNEKAIADSVASLTQYYEQEFIPRLSPNSEREVFARDFISADPATRALQYMYISSNLEEVGEKDHMISSPFSTSYDEVHAFFHPTLHSFQEEFGYYDLFLVEINTGHIVYSVFKEVDFATSLLDGPFQDSQIGVVFQKARAADYPGFVRLTDFAPYEPSYNAQASFIASPIFDGDEKIGVLIFQMPIGKINDIMTNNSSWKEVGLGKSGETYLVGSNFTLRNESRFLVEDKEGYLQAIRESGVPERVAQNIDNLNSAIGLQPIKTEGANAALNGQSDTWIFEDYRGVSVLSAFCPLDIPDVQWAIMSEIDENEAKEPLRSMQLQFLFIFLGLGPLVLVSAYFFSRSITKRLKRLDSGAMELAKGHLDIEMDISGTDEIGSLAQSFNKMKSSIRDLIDKQNSTIKALSASLIPLTHDIGVMTLVGSFDDRRVQMVRDNLTTGLQEAFRRVVILDITGVPVIDYATSQGLIKIAKAARLMGARVILTGINPQMAADMVDLDLHLEGILIENSLQRGIDEALRMMKNEN